jgi:hypothetical protein
VKPSWSSMPFAAALVICGCGDSNYQKAAIATGVAVATVGLHRAITGDCWARCTAGHVCNWRTGLCERGECAPACAVGWSCVRTSRGELVCEQDIGSLSIGAGAVSSPQRLDAGVAVDGGARHAVTDASPGLGGDAAE